MKKTSGNKKAKVLALGVGSIADTLFEDADQESDHAYGAEVETVKVPVQKPNTSENQ